MAKQHENDGERKNMKVRKAVIAGGGVLGSQISLMCAYAGIDTIIRIRQEDPEEQTRAKLDRYSAMMLSDLEFCRQQLGESENEAVYPHGMIQNWEGLTEKQLDEQIQWTRARIPGSIRITSDLSEEVFADADIVIEAVTEDPDMKIAFYESVRELLPGKTILVSNSSTLLPSRFAEHTGRPEKFCALHFANTIWRCNTAEIMGHPGTDPEVFDQVVEFAKQLNMIALPLHKEQPGYILNSVLVPWLAAGEALWVNGVADPQTIDLTWKAGLGCPFGPFEHIDVIGLDTVYAINRMKPDAKVEGSTIYKLNQLLKEKIDRGETGVNAGKGFYDYSSSDGEGDKAQ